MDLAKGVKLTLAKNVDLGFHPREVGEHVAKVAAKAGGHVAKVVAKVGDHAVKVGEHFAKVSAEVGEHAAKVAAKVGEHPAGRSANTILTGFDMCPHGGCAGKKPV